MSSKEVTVRAGHKVMMEVDDNILPIVGNPQGIFDQLLRPQPICLLNINVILIK
jgi:hypothetical protein